MEPNIMHDNIFFMDQQLEVEVVEPGKLSRKVRALGGSLMMVEAIFQQGAIGYEHEHPHEQMCYCLSGEFTFTVGETSKRLGPGDSVYIPANARHGAVCTKEGSLLDIFTPQREDIRPLVSKT